VHSTKRWVLSVVLGTGVALILAFTLKWSLDMRLHLEGKAEAAIEAPSK
jgi:hypothetical protein